VWGAGMWGLADAEREFNAANALLATPIDQWTPEVDAQFQDHVRRGQLFGAVGQLYAEVGIGLVGGPLFGNTPFLSAATAGFTTDWVVQTTFIATGVQREYNPLQNILAGLTGGVLDVAARAVMRGAAWIGNRLRGRGGWQGFWSDDVGRAFPEPGR